MENKAFVAYTNMYVILVGPPGVKKSAAVRAGKNLLKRVPGIHLMPDAPSVVGVMKAFQAIPQKDHQSMSGFFLELSSLYENAGESMVGFLTALYDCDEGYRKWTRVGQIEELHHPWLNSIAGTTPRWLADNMHKNAEEGGLFSRTIHVYSEQVIARDPWPEITAEHLKLQDALVHDLAHISQQYFMFDFDGGKQGDAYNWYYDWYMNLSDVSRVPRGVDTRIAGYFARKPTHILKVAMALALGRSDRQVLTTEDLVLAKAWLEVVEPGMSEAFAGVGANKHATEINKMGSLIAKAGAKGMSYPELIQIFYGNMELPEIQRALTTLQSWGRIEGNMSEGYRSRKAHA